MDANTAALARYEREQKDRDADWNDIKGEFFDECKIYERNFGIMLDDIAMMKKRISDSLEERGFDGSKETVIDIIEGCVGDDADLLKLLDIAEGA